MKKIFIGSAKLAKGMEEIQYRVATKRLKETVPFYYGFSTVFANNTNNIEKKDRAKLVILELQRKSGAIKENTDYYLADIEKISAQSGVNVEI